MKRLLFAAGLVSACMFTSCLTINAKKIVEAPYVPPKVEGADVGEVEKLSMVYYSTSSRPEIDGKFDEWKNLEGVHTRQQVYGGMFDPNNADGFFVSRTDGTKLYVYAKITDDSTAENLYEAPQAWRGDSVEFFFGTDTSKHTAFKDTDVRVRLIPRSKTDKFAVTVGLNDVEINSEDIKAAVVFDSTGYQVEAEFPLSLLGGKMLKKGQNVRFDYQINDADNGKERTGLLHWHSPNDNTYADPSGWGDGKVVALPE